MDIQTSRNLEHRDLFVTGNTLVAQADNGIISKHAHDQILKSFSDAIEAYTKAINLVVVHQSDYRRARSDAYRKRAEYKQLHGIDTNTIPADFIAALLDNPECDKNLYNIAVMQPNHASTLIFKMESYNKAIAINQSLARYYNGRGDVYKFQNEHEKAADDYLKALELDRDCPSTKSKKQLLELLIKLSPEKQLLLLKDAYLNHESVLYQRMYKPENITIPMFTYFEHDHMQYDFIKCKPTKGVLKEISEQIKKLEPDWVDPHAPQVAVINGEEPQSSYISFPIL